MALRGWMATGLLIGWMAVGCGGDDAGSDDPSASGGSGGSSAAGGGPSERGDGPGSGGAAGASSPGEGAGGSGSGGTASAGSPGEGAGSPGSGGVPGGGGQAGRAGADGGGSGAGGAGAAAGAAGEGDVTVHPDRIDEVLTNPGMGPANFHFGWWCNLPPVDFTPEDCAARTRENWPENHPDCGTAYFRWTWRELEPERGSIAFDLIDRALESANALDETLGFRVASIADDSVGIPDWLVSITPGEQRPSAGGTTYWPDYRDPTYRAEHARFVAALAERYDGHPSVDHVDIGSVGCWGEWNTACLTDGAGLFGIYAPADAAAEQATVDAYTALIDAYLESFEQTPLVMLGLGGGGETGERDVFVHAIAAGTGWRVDCWGDWGIFGDSWNHQIDSYPTLISQATAVLPGFPDTWQHAPVQLEVCDTLPGWADRGWTVTPPDGEIYRSFQWALEQHASVLNLKWTDIPEQYRGALDELLVHNGYRFVVDALSHPGERESGDPIEIASTWTNLGVAPLYLERTLAYRLRGDPRTLTFESAEDLREWLPGTTTVTDVFTLPADLPAGRYRLEVAILDRAGESPATAALPPLRLGIEGRGEDGWYDLSAVTVR
ncbi:MAG: DUF4832 domain-containing protein [Polyangiaceae bacterium]|nr:DUF4832 domain-containing protein [Polyangiaceae bacterium]